MDHQRTFDSKMVYIQVDNVLVIFFFFCLKALANVGPKGELLATPSSVLSKIKCKSLVATDKSSLNPDLLKLSTASDSLKVHFAQIVMVSFKSMLVNRESTSKLPIQLTLRIS